MGSGGIVPPFLTSVLDRSGRFHILAPLSPEEGSTVTRWIRGCVGHKAGLEAVEKRKNLFFRDSNPNHPALKYTD
jgi:hypothetical protein